MLGETLRVLVVNRPITGDEQGIRAANMRVNLTISHDIAHVFSQDPVGPHAGHPGRSSETGNGRLQHAQDCGENDASIARFPENEFGLDAVAFRPHRDLVDSGNSR
jgi:hypothetical protein